MRLPRITLLYTPATRGCGLPLASSANGLWPGTVMPQSKRFPVTMLSAIRLPCVGPNSSVRRMPPSLALEWLPRTTEWATPIRWIPSPQSPGICPLAAHCGYGEVGLGGIPPVLFPTTQLSVMLTSLIEPPASVPVARMPSPIAPVTVKPDTSTCELLMVTPARQGAAPGPMGPSWSHINVVVGLPLIVALRPSRLRGADTTTSSV